MSDMHLFSVLLLAFAALTGPLSVWIIRWGFNAPALTARPTLEDCP